MPKLYEIEGYLSGIKIRRRSWTAREYIFFNQINWVDGDGEFQQPNFLDNVCDYDDWETYEETKKKRKMWRWLVESATDIYITESYYDENGKGKDPGCVYMETDDSRKFTKYGEPIEVGQ